MTGMCLVLSTVEVRKEFTGFQVTTNLTPFEDDAEIW